MIDAMPPTRLEEGRRVGGGILVRVCAREGGGRVDVSQKACQRGDQVDIKIRGVTHLGMPCKLCTPQVSWSPKRLSR